MKLHALFTVEYNVPVCGAVRRRIRMRQRPVADALGALCKLLTFQPAHRSGSIDTPRSLPLPLPHAVWLGGVALASIMVLVGMELTPDVTDAPSVTVHRVEPVVAAATVVSVAKVEPAQTLQAAAPVPETRPVYPSTETVATMVAGERLQDEAIRDAVTRWADAWSRRDVQGYVSAYSPDYTGQASDRAGWERERRSRIEARRFIRVQLSDIEIEGGVDMVRVTFTQNYRSDALQESTRKTLTLLRDGRNRWLIVRET